ncbi:hypothetical protein MPLSOD_80210 [Mesorhizobium sp. SOD10]|nr:hypothetical protein MPLSOD_80210 [Mesorhizobium sp. SOD10]
MTDCLGWHGYKSGVASAGVCFSATPRQPARQPFLSWLAGPLALRAQVHFFLHGPDSPSHCTGEFCFAAWSPCLSLTARHLADSRSRTFIPCP